MAIDAEKVSVRPVLWSAQVRDDLGQDCGESQLDFWFQQIASEKALAYEIYDDGTRLGTIVVSFEEWNDGAKEMVIGPLGGHFVEAFQAVAPFMYEIAGVYNVDRVRVNTRRPGVMELLSPHGFDLDHYSLVKSMRAG